MPALWSPDQLSIRFAPYIAELHDIFAMHGQHYGSPENIPALADRLESSSGFSDELGSLMRSIVLREGGALPRTDLLEILAIAAAGPNMDPAGHELQHSVRRLLSFLHSVLRRPWNEPPGEERLHPPQLPVDVMLYRRAAKPEAARLADHGTRSNVIPLVGFRAIYSKVTRMEPRPGDELSPAPESGPTRIVLPGCEVTDSASETCPADRQAPAQAGEFIIESGPPAPPVSMPEPETPELESTIGESIAPAEAPAETPVRWAAPVEVEALIPTEDLGGYPTIHTPTAEPAQPPTPDFNSVAAVVPGDLAPAVTADSDSVAVDILPATDIPPMETAPELAAPALAGVPVAATNDVFLASQPSALVRRMPPTTTTFDAEPALPSSARPSRFVVIGSAAAVVLVAAVVILALEGKSGGADDAVRLAPNLSAPGVSATTTVAGAAKSTPFAEARTPAVPPAKPSAYVPNLPLPPQSGRRMRPSADDYIAPPYSNMPPVQPESASQISNAAPVPIANAHPIRSVSNSATPVSLAASVRNDASLHVNGDPDKRLVGDLATRRAEPTALLERPGHPSVPSAVMASNVISAPRPGYPMLAKLAHAEGEVTLEADISRTGSVSPIRVVSGHHLLRHAAEDAVRRWRYRPYVVNGRAVEISTTITVHFRDH